MQNENVLSLASLVTMISSAMLIKRWGSHMIKRQKFKTGLCYDECFLLHHANGKHVENPGRVKSAMELLTKENIIKRCELVPSREATKDEILLVHDEKVINYIENTLDFTDSVHLGNDIFANQYTSHCASVAAGISIRISQDDNSVMDDNNEIANGFAIIRPPGHHAGKDLSMGFCVYNNVAIAARAIQEKFGRQTKIAIIDWDVHHGNGTEEIFYDDNTVLYFSVHKYGNSFYPGTGNENDCGVGKGEGFNVNSPFYSKKMGDGDYITLFKKLYLPILTEFSPDLIIVSAGFDCGENDKLGPMRVSTMGFSQMMSLLASVSKKGKIICALEGGYTYDTTSQGILACVNVLLGNPPLAPEDSVASIDGWNDINKAIDVQKRYWPILNNKTPEF